MATTEGTRAAAEEEGDSLKARLTYHFRRLREDATDPELTTLERLALVRDRATRIR